jgi:hypothetical protein
MQGALDRVDAVLVEGVCEGLSRVQWSAADQWSPSLRRVRLRRGGNCVYRLSVGRVSPDYLRSRSYIDPLWLVGIVDYYRRIGRIVSPNWSWRNLRQCENC